MVIDALVYLSVLLGVGLLIQINGVLPSEVFFSILGGWSVYLVAAIFVSRGYTKVYPLVLVLAVLTLAVSLPQPAHYAFVTNTQILAASTFIVGSALQICLIVLIPLFLMRRRRSATTVATAS
jgi:hypothetical protein